MMGVDEIGGDSSGAALTSTDSFARPERVGSGALVRSRSHYDVLRRLREGGLATVME